MPTSRPEREQNTNYRLLKAFLVLLPFLFGLILILIGKIDLLLKAFQNSLILLAVLLIAYFILVSVILKLVQFANSGKVAKAKKKQSAYGSQPIYPPAYSSAPVKPTPAPKTTWLPILIFAVCTALIILSQVGIIQLPKIDLNNFNNSDQRSGSNTGLSTGGGPALKILSGNTVNACYDSFTGNISFVPQTLLAAGGEPFTGYTWNTMGFPIGTTVWPQTGVFLSNGGTIDVSKEDQPFTAEVSDGTSSATGTVIFHIATISSAPSGGIPQPGCPEPVFQQYQGLETFQLEDAVANKPYGASLPVIGGTPPYSWFEDPAYSGRGDFNLSGLVIDQNTGIVRGTPFNSAAGKTLRFKIIVKDSSGYPALEGPVFIINVK